MNAPGHGYSHDGDLYLDADGNRYTTSVMATPGDPWWGATILTRSTVAALQRDGRLPLTEVVCLWNHDRLTRRARRGWRVIIRRRNTASAS